MKSIFCLVIIAMFSGCGDHQLSMSPAAKTKSERWMELRTRFHRYDAIAGNDKFRDFKIQFVALLEYLMLCDPMDEDECGGMEFFFPAFDKALEHVRAGGRTTGGLKYPMFMDTIGEIQTKMNALVEDLARDLVEGIDHPKSLARRIRMDALRGALLNDASMYLLLAIGDGVLAARTRLFPVPSQFRRERVDNKFNFHGTFHFNQMMRICRRSNIALNKRFPNRERTKCLGMVVRVFHTYYTDRVLRTQNAPLVDPPIETEFYGLELSFQQAIEGYDYRIAVIDADMASVILTAMELLSEPIPAGDKLTALVDANRKIRLFVAKM